MRDIVIARGTCRQSVQQLLNHAHKLTLLRGSRYRHYEELEKVATARLWCARSRNSVRPTFATNRSAPLDASAHSGTEDNGEMPEFLTNTQDTENAIERPRCERFKQLNSLPRVVEFHLHFIRFTVMLKRNHSLRSGGFLATSFASHRLCTPVSFPSWSDFQ